MKMHHASCCAAAVLLLVGSGTARAEEPVSREALQTAVRRGLALLVQTSPTFIKKGGCNSCHNQMLPAAAQGFARSRGIEVGEPIEQLPGDVSEMTTERYAEYSVAPGGGVNALSFELFASDLARQPAMKELFIRWTRITNEGADRLAKALPNCAVHHHALTAN